MLFNEKHKHFILDKACMSILSAKIVMTFVGEEQTGENMGSSTVLVMDAIACLNKRSESDMAKY